MRTTLKLIILFALFKSTHGEQFFSYSSRFTNNSDSTGLSICINLTECKFPSAITINCLDYLKKIKGIDLFSTCNSSLTVLNITDNKFTGNKKNNTLLSFQVPIQCLPSYNRNISAVLGAISGDYVMLSPDALLVFGSANNICVFLILALLIIVSI